MSASAAGYDSRRYAPGRHRVDTFRCGGDESLDRWLRQSAANEAARGVSSTFVWTPEDDDEVVAYYSLAAHAVTRGSLPSTLQSGNRDPVPAALIGKLALADQLHGQGLGGQLLRDALERLVVASRSGPAFRVIVVDAVDEAVAGFYRRYGFQSIPGRSSRLVIHLGRVAEALGMNAPEQ